MSETIPVALGARSYAVHVGAGLLKDAGQLLSPFATRGKVPVITDEHVAALHLDRVLASLDAAGISTEAVILPPGEESKSFPGLERLTSQLLRCGVERGGLVVALGGGVVGDLVGFASGVLKRGIDFAQIPTTLLAQVDSSVGGKTAINSPEGKNLIGIFHQPKIVIADIETLASLPDRERRAGYAEVAKYGALGDAEFFAWLETHAAPALAGDNRLLTKLIAHSVRMKAEIVARDETEAGDRALLNLGHTFGHALEAATGYSQRLLHGEGVAVGMVLAFRLSARLALAPIADANRVEHHLRHMGLPAAIADIPGPRPDPDDLVGHMMHDKKTRDGRLTFVLARGIGHAFQSRDVPFEALSEILRG